MLNVAPIDYALAFDPCVVFVARALDTAAPAAVSIEALARDYKHTNKADYSRIKRHEHIEDDADATRWLINRALAYLSDWVTVDGEVARFAEGKSLKDVRLHDGSTVEPLGPDPHEKLGDPFNPMSGWAAGNIRVHVPPSKLSEAQKKADEDLRESLKAHGWLPHLPAIIDERGVVLAGHRRLAMAEELGIEPVYLRMTLGVGDTSDSVRLLIAINSNVGGLPLSKEDRKFIAEQLTLKGWNQQDIAAKLHVGQKTISNDLEGFSNITKTSGSPPKRGRKQGSKGWVKAIVSTLGRKYGFEGTLIKDNKAKYQITLGREIPKLFSSAADAQRFVNDFERIVMPAHTHLASLLKSAEEPAPPPQRSPQEGPQEAPRERKAPAGPPPSPAATAAVQASAMPDTAAPAATEPEPEPIKLCPTCGRPWPEH